MNPPTKLTADEKARLLYVLAVDEDDEDEVATLDSLVTEIEETIDAHLAAVTTTVVVNDLTIEGQLPLPAISWHALTADQFKQIVAAFPGVDWEDTSKGPHIAYLSGDYNGVRLTVWAPRAPAPATPEPKPPSYAAILLAEARS